MRLHWRVLALGCCVGSAFAQSATPTGIAADSRAQAEFALKSGR